VRSSVISLSQLSCRTTKLLLRYITLTPLRLSQSSFISNASRFPKHFLEDSRASSACPSSKSDTWMKMGVERWWNGSDRNFIWTRSAYRAVNTLCLGYKYQSVNAVWGNNRCCFGQHVELLNIEPDGTYRITGF
jgi:hypothetical protein